ncbi:MAG TPA: response regulator transcription factor [Actinomycetota bacterium]
MNPTPIKVIIADDHLLVRQILRGYLEKSDDVVVIGEANNGHELLKILENGGRDADVALLDVRMPDMDGLQLAKAIKERHLSVRVVMLSAYDDQRFVAEAVRAGADGYVLKTGRVEHLIDAIRAVASGKMVIDPELMKAFAEDAAIRTDPERSAERISPRERDVLQVLAAGRTNREIAETLSISPETVKAHLDHVYEKLGTSDRTSAVAEAYRRGVID